MLATQNPIEQEGTYPLPEAQIDRFLLQIDVALSVQDLAQDHQPAALRLIIPDQNPCPKNGRRFLRFEPARRA
jgi:hypothetical protein